jgi:hypothetical protein
MARFDLARKHTSAERWQIAGFALSGVLVTAGAVTILGWFGLAAYGIVVWYIVDTFYRADT